MKIVKLTVENFMRISAVEIRPDGNLVRIAGANSSGKTSIITAMISALGGAKFAPAEPIRRGAEFAKAILEFPDLTVTAKWRANEDGETIASLLVTNKEGFKTPKPQTFLDRLSANGVAFDPLAFSRLSPEEQAAQLRKIVGLDTSALDAERKSVYEGRTDVNRYVKTAETQLAAIPIPPTPEDAGEIVDLADIAEKKTVAAEIKAENVRKRSAATVASDIARKALAEVERLTALLEEAKKTYDLRSQEAVDAQEEAKGLIDPDTSVIDAEISAARKHNEAVQIRKREADRSRDVLRRRSDLDVERAKYAKRSDELNARLDAIDEAKAKMLAETKMPYPGMSIDDDQVFVNGIPFSQASTAEQIRIGLELGSALNPEFRIAFCRDGSLLDPDTLQIVSDWADLNDTQVWLEVVSSKADGINGFWIEDGSLIEAE